MRSRNRALVLAEALATSPTTRSAIAGATQLSPATVSRMVDSLLAEAILRESDEVASGKRGRRATLVEVAARRSVVIGIDVGASSTRVVVADLLGEPIGERTSTTPAEAGAEELAGWVAEQAVSTAASDADRVAAVAVGVPGAVRSAERSIWNAPNLPQVEDPAFLRHLEARLGRTVEVDNDSNYALLGELRFGAARTASTAVMLTIGAGLGAGVALDGRILQGRNGLVGEFGQLPVGPMGTALEHLVTGRGITRRASELGFPISSPAAIFAPDAAPQLVAMRRHLEQALLVVLTTAVVSYEPEVIVVGGGIAGSIAPGLEQLSTDLARTVGSAPPVVLAQLHDMSGAFGAVVAALHTVYLDLGLSPEDLVRVPHLR